MSFPILDIDLRETRDEQFQFLLTENRNKFCRDNVMEAYRQILLDMEQTCEELPQLVFNTRLKFIFRDKSDILRLILIRNRNRVTFWNKVDNMGNTVLFHDNRE